MVSGEPGIGKSSVVQEAERIARATAARFTRDVASTATSRLFSRLSRSSASLSPSYDCKSAERTAPPDVDLTGTHVAGLPAESAVRLLAIVNDYRGELLRVAPEPRKYLPGEAYRQDRVRARRRLHPSRTVGVLHRNRYARSRSASALKTCNGLTRHRSTCCGTSPRPWPRPGRTADGSMAVPRLVIVASARTGYPQLDALMTPLRERHQVMELRLSR